MFAATTTRCATTTTGSGAERLSASHSRYSRGGSDVAALVPNLRLRRPAAAKTSKPPTTEARLRPGRQGVQRIYRMATEKSQIGVYEYLESIGVPRVNALQVQSQASEWFEFENAKAGGASDAPFGVEEMSKVVKYLMDRGVEPDDVGKLVCAHPPVLAYSVENRLDHLFEYLSELGLDSNEVVENLTRRPNLLGLDPDQNMRKMVDYLMSTGNTQEESLEYLLRTL